MKHKHKAYFTMLVGSPLVGQTGKVLRLCWPPVPSHRMPLSLQASIQQPENWCWCHAERPLHWKGSETQDPSFLGWWFAVGGCLRGALSGEIHNREARTGCRGTARWPLIPFLEGMNLRIDSIHTNVLLKGESLSGFRTLAHLTVQPNEALHNIHEDMLALSEYIFKDKSIF